MPPLEKEVDKSYKHLDELLTGRRIVNLGHVLREYGKVLDHKNHCTMGKMEFIKESSQGFLTYLYFYCDNCEKTKIITSEPVGPSGNDINKAGVWGALSIGIGHSQCEEFFSVLDVPFMTPKKFVKETRGLKEVIGFRFSL